MKKGFTLVELLGVIIIIALLSTAVYQVFVKEINTTKQKSYENQIDKIISISKDYHLKNISNDGVLITTLLNEGLIKNDTIIDPRNNKQIDGCIRFETNEYEQISYNYCNGSKKLDDTNCNCDGI